MKNQRTLYRPIVYKGYFTQSTELEGLTQFWALQVSFFIKTTFLRSTTFRRVSSLPLNKTGTSRVGAVSKAQKAQNIFLEKNLKFRKKILSESVAQCRKM